MLKVGRKRFKKISEINPEFPSRKQWNKNTWILYPRKVKNLQEISGEHKDQKHCCCDFFQDYLLLLFYRIQYTVFLDGLRECIHRGSLEHFSWASVP